MQFPRAFYQATRLGLGVILLLTVQIVGCGGGGGGGSTTTPATHQMGGARQGTALNLVPWVGTLAGVGSVADGTGAEARFVRPGQIASDGTNLFVVDSESNSIRKVVIATGVVTTLAGGGGSGFASGSADGMGREATFYQPNGIATDGSNLYVADTYNGKIRQIVIATGEVTTLAGTGTFGAADGSGATASFNLPYGIAIVGSNLYVADTENNKIRKIEITAGAVTVSSFTGEEHTKCAEGAKDGGHAQALFSSPRGITSDGTNLYVADSINHKIRRIVIATSEVSNLTGEPDKQSTAGAADGSAYSATFNFPHGITTDGTNLFVADHTNNKIRVVGLTTGKVSSFTGVTNTTGKAGAEDGPGTEATFNKPFGVITVGAYLYVSDFMSGTIRKVALSNAAVTTLAGNGQSAADGTGAQATFGSPFSLTSDGSNLYVADTENNKIRKIVIASGVVTTLAGTGAAGAADGAGSIATFIKPKGITTDGTHLYVADTGNNKIRKIEISTGLVSSLTGTPNAASDEGVADGAVATATFKQPNGITTDGSNLYVADTGNNKIRKIEIATGEVSSVTGVGSTPIGIGTLDGPGTTAQFYTPCGITTDGTNLYVADTFNSKIRKIVIASGMVSSLTGEADKMGVGGAADGAGLVATFRRPTGITTDGSNLYVTDELNNKIRKIVIASGEVSSVTGPANSEAEVSVVEGPGATVRIENPFGITTDGSSLFVSGSFPSIRKIY